MADEPSPEGELVNEALEQALADKRRLEAEVVATRQRIERDAEKRVERERRAPVRARTRTGHRHETLLGQA